MKKLFCFVVILMFSGCAGVDFTPKLDTEPMDKSGFVYGTGSLSTTIVQDPKNLQKFCLGRGGDAAFEQSESGDLAVSLVSIGKTSSESGEESESSGEEEMSGRTPAVLMTRELFYRACELMLNAQLDKNESIQIFNNVLKTVGQGWERESANTKVSVSDQLTVQNTNTDNLSAAKLPQPQSLSQSTGTQGSQSTGAQACVDPRTNQPPTTQAQLTELQQNKVEGC